MAMHHRHTQADRNAFERDYLRTRMPHIWQDATGDLTCYHCHVRYTAHRAAGQRCPKRHKPNRWRVHLRRAWTRENATRRIAPKMDGPGILAQLQTIEQGIHRPSTLHDDRWWKYNREARRYRRLMSAWWALPSAETSRALCGHRDEGRAPSTGWMTTGRNRLIKQARETGQRTFVVKGCTYTLFDGAFV